MHPCVNVTHVPPTNQALLREFIHIPERTSTSDFVLKLTEGVTDAEATLRDYVITDQLVANFDQALGLISSAVGGGGSKAAYLHGSFGSGKSHFMAVLHALLKGEPAARSRDELAGVLAKNDAWLAGKRYLLVPYYMLGAKSMEQRVLGGYADYVRALHPDAPIPAVHRTDALLDNARHLRARMGDAKFIEGLPGGDDDEWGDEERYWTPQRLDEAFAAGHDDTQRRRLVSDLLTSWLPVFVEDAREDAEGFISLDRGLTEIAAHAKGLGYDGLVLFLDELILWLANAMGDQEFVSREVQKVTNFIEGGDAQRPIPIISFIARQRDLRELVGEHVAGAVQLSFQDTLNLASGRFDLITLEDRNLPLIANRRLLTPVSHEARMAIADAFESTTKVRHEVWDALLGTDGTTGADIDSFRLSYPFSPAFMDTLVHVSSALQRSRTALKLMRQLLVDHRDDLRLGQLVPLGDLYEVISRGGDQPFTEKLKAEFEAAQKLYETRLRPYLLGQNGLGEDDVERIRRTPTAADPQLAARVRAFTGDDRLIRTLLLSALAPSVPALRNLTVRRLSALNHGSITSPIPGQENARVARKVEDWSGQFGEIKFVPANDPGVSLELVGVEVDSILASAGHYDGIGARKLLVKRLLWEEMGVAATGTFIDHAELTWRGSKRSVEIFFGNVRDTDELRDETFHPLDPSSWRLIVDYPFDEGTHGSADARQRVDRLIASGEPARTVCWLPAHFTAERLGDLRHLVVLDGLLGGQRFDSHAQHLGATDRQRARAILESRRDALLAKIRGVLRQAYGLARKHPDDVGTAFDDHLLTLRPGLRPTLPVGAAMKDALRRIAGDMFVEQFPAHPDFDPDRTGALVRPADAKVVFSYVRAAVEADDGRVEVAKPDRATMKRIANPLELGEMHEAAFVVGRYWVEHFQRMAAKEEIAGELKVADLTRWTDQPDPRGLERLVAGLVVACFAEQTDRAWLRHGGLLDPPPEITAITGDMALREQRLPAQQEWDTARTRAAKILGVTAPTLLRGRLVRGFVAEVCRNARQHVSDARVLVDRLERHAVQLGLEVEAGTGRLHTARRALDLLESLDDPRAGAEIVTRLAGADLGGPADRTARSIKSARHVADVLASAPWDNFEMIARLGEPHRAEAQNILDVLSRVAHNDELTESLPSALAATRADATALLRRVLPTPTPTPRPTPPKPVPPAPPLVLPQKPEPRVTPSSLPPESARSGERHWQVQVADLDKAVAELRDVAAGQSGDIEITWRPGP